MSNNVEEYGKSTILSAYLTAYSYGAVNDKFLILFSSSLSNTLIWAITESFLKNSWRFS